jgi:hypothetical protein
LLSNGGGGRCFWQVLLPENGHLGVKGGQDVREGEFSTGAKAGREGPVAHKACFSDSACSLRSAATDFVISRHRALLTLQLVCKSELRLTTDTFPHIEDIRSSSMCGSSM